jgi:hypothetical protein
MIQGQPWDPIESHYGAKAKNRGSGDHGVDHGYDTGVGCDDGISLFFGEKNRAG